MAQCFTQHTNEPKPLLLCAEIDLLFDLLPKIYFRSQLGITYFFKIHNARAWRQIHTSVGVYYFLVLMMLVYPVHHKAFVCLCGRRPYPGSICTRSGVGLVFESFYDPGVCGFRYDPSFCGLNKIRKLQWRVFWNWWQYVLFRLTLPLCCHGYSHRKIKYKSSRL